MKKINAIIITVLAVLLMMSNAHAVETSDSAICSLSWLDSIAESHGYEVIADTADGVVRQYTCTTNGIRYEVTIADGFLTRSTVDTEAEYDAGAITGTHVLVDGEHVVANYDFLRNLFIDYITMDVVDEALVRSGYTIDESAPVPHYTIGDDIEGVSITVVGSLLTVYAYGEDYGDVSEFDLAISAGSGIILVPTAMLGLVI